MKFQRYDQNWLTGDCGPPSQKSRVGDNPEKKFTVRIEPAGTPNLSIMFRPPFKEFLLCFQRYKKNEFVNQVFFDLR